MCSCLLPISQVQMGLGRCKLCGQRTNSPYLCIQWIWNTLMLEGSGWETAFLITSTSSTWPSGSSCVVNLFHLYPLATFVGGWGNAVRLVCMQPLRNMCLEHTFRATILQFHRFHGVLPILSDQKGSYKTTGVHETRKSRLLRTRKC